jgi:hypothetical protein
MEEAPVPGDPSDQPPAVQQEKETSAVAKEKNDPLVADDPPTPESRRKRMLKAVGRFLHIGTKKDQP